MDELANWTSHYDEDLGTVLVEVVQLARKALAAGESKPDPDGLELAARSDAAQ